MARYALVRNSKVANVCEWNGDPSVWSPPQGASAIQSDVANIGDIWDGTTFTPDTTPPPPDPLAADKARIFAYMPASGSATATAVSNYIADTTKDPAIRATMAALRSLVRIVRSDLS